VVFILIEETEIRGSVKGLHICQKLFQPGKLRVGEEQTEPGILRERPQPRLLKPGKGLGEQGPVQDRSETAVPRRIRLQKGPVSPDQLGHDVQGAFVMAMYPGHVFDLAAGKGTLPCFLQNPGHRMIIAVIKF
jgi:hypothetical protein